MNAGKTLFAQIMDFLRWKTFHRIVALHGGDKGVRTLTCAEQFRAMALAQLTYRESLRDIEACLLAQAAKLYHMGFREPVARSTLADANESRDWRIWEAFAGRLIIQARELYLSEDLGLDLTNTVYALDSTTIDLCLSVFPWAHFRTTKAAVKMHTLLDLKGSIPSFIHVSDGKLHDVHALDLLELEAGAIYVMDRGYVDFARLHALHLAGAFFVTRAKSNMKWHRVYSMPTDRTTGIICDQCIALDGVYTKQEDDMNRRQLLRSLCIAMAGMALPGIATAASRKRVTVVGIGAAGCNLAIALRASNILDGAGAVLSYVCVDLGPHALEFVDTANDANPALTPIKTLMLAPVRAGGRVNAARAACLRHRATLAEMLAGSNMVVLLAGLGGGTGSGVTPVVAQMAHEAGAVTVAAVVTPFEYEGVRNRRADAVVDRLRREADLVMAFSNEEWANRSSGDTPLFDVFDALDRHIAGSLYSVISRLSATVTRASFSFTPDRLSV